MEVGYNPLVDWTERMSSLSSPADTFWVNLFFERRMQVLFLWQFLLEWGSREQWGEWHWTGLDVEEL